MEDKSQIWPKQLILWKHSRQVALYRSSMMRKLIQSHKQTVHKFPSEKDDGRFVTLGSPKVVGPVVGPYLWLFGFDYCDESKLLSYLCHCIQPVDPTDIQRGPQAAISLLSLWPLRVLLSLNSLPKRGQTIVPKKYSVTVWFDNFIYNNLKTIRRKWKSPQKRLVSC